jgi:hypothetical protein
MLIESEVKREYREHQIFEFRHGLMRQQVALAAKIECAAAALAKVAARIQPCRDADGVMKELFGANKHD